MDLYSILMNDNVVDEINNNIKYLSNVVPEITAMFNFPHKHPHHHLNVWHHTLYALSLSEKDFEVRLTLLLHDIGKPFSYIEENGIRHFPNHAQVSAVMTRNILTRLKYDDIFIDRICYLVRFHDTPIKENDIKNNYELSYKRFLVQECDALAHHPNKLEKRKIYLAKTKKLLNYHQR